MRLGAIAGEARRNIASGTSHAGLGFFVLAIVLIGLSLADVLAITRLQSDAQRFVSAQAATRGLATTGDVDGRACDALVNTDTIRSAGAIGQATPLVFLAMPTVAIQSYRVTPGLAGVIGVDQPLPSGVWLDRGLADTLMVRQGDRLTTTRGTLTVAGLFDWPQDGRDQRLSFSVLVPEVPIQPYDQCWMRAWPTVDGNDLLLRATQRRLVDDPNSSLIAQLNQSFGATLDAHSLFETRITRHGPILLLLASLALGFAITRSRRLEHASALHAGQAKTDQLLACLIETSAWAIPATAVAAIACRTIIARLAPVDPGGVLANIAPGLTMALAGPVLGAAAGCCLTREKHLFALFKTR
jgi:hypothetical protein